MRVTKKRAKATALALLDQIAPLGLAEKFKPCMAELVIEARHAKQRQGRESDESATVQESTPAEPSPAAEPQAEVEPEPPQPAEEPPAMPAPKGRKRKPYERRTRK